MRLLALSLVLILVGSAVEGQDSGFSRRKKSGEKGSTRTQDRVTHYAFMSTGPAGRSSLGKMYWACNERIEKMLKGYGYTDETIFRFSEYEKSPTLDGQATIANWDKTFKHLARIMKRTDYLFIYLIGHGGPSGKDFVHSLVDGRLTSTKLAAMINQLPTTNITIAMNPCFSGGFIKALSAKNRVICTSTNNKETNSVGWAESFCDSITRGSPADTNGDGRVSMKEAYVSALANTQKAYGKNLREHPLLDDNGDGQGSFDFDNGDGKLAEERFIGNEGGKLTFSSSALRKLSEANRSLVLE